MSLRILLVVHAWPPEAAGGTGVVVGALSRALADQGHDVTVAHPGESEVSGVREAPRRSDGVRVVGVGIRGGGRGWAAGWRRGQPHVRALLEELRPQVVDIHHLSGWPLHLPQLARAAGARVVMTLHDYAVPCARGQMVDRQHTPCSGPSPARCSDCLAPFLGIQARLLGRPSRRDRARVSERLTLARHALAAAHVRLAPSRDLADRIQQLGGGPVELCPLPCTPALPPDPGPGQGPVRFLFCSSIIPTKGPHLLVEAFRRLPPGTAKLTVAGPQPPFPAAPGYAARLCAEIRSLDGAQWVGNIPHSEVPTLLRAHDVLVLPSVWRENSPVIVREACAAGLRTIVSDRGGATELDPLAIAVDTRGERGAVDRLHAALVAECHRGRERRAPIAWPSAADCANWLARHVYGSSETAIGPKFDYTPHSTHTDR